MWLHAGHLFHFMLETSMDNIVILPPQTISDIHHYGNSYNTCTVGMSVSAAYSLPCPVERIHTPNKYSSVHK